VAAFLDYLSSLILGGMLIVNVLSANDIATETYSVYEGDMVVQEMLITTVQLLEGEFRNMGFGVPEDQRTVLGADTSDVMFLLDLERDGVSIDTIRYQLGSTSELSHTMNAADRYLYRKVNGGQFLKVGVVTLFHLRYIAEDGVVLSAPVASDQLSEIHEIEITLEIQNPYAPYAADGYVGGAGKTALYSSSFWQQTRLASQNTRR
jgi:hypothetical protein